MLTETLVVILLEFFDVPYENNYTRRGVVTILIMQIVNGNNLSFTTFCPLVLGDS